MTIASLMQILLLTIFVISCKENPGTGSGLKEFEDSQNICQDVQNWAKKERDANPGDYRTSGQIFQAKKQIEDAILDTYIRDCTTAASTLDQTSKSIGQQSSQNEPVPGAGPTNIDPSTAQTAPTSATADNSLLESGTYGLNEYTSTPTNTLLSNNSCPSQETAAQARSAAAFYQSQKAKLNTCQMPVSNAEKEEEQWMSDGTKKELINLLDKASGLGEVCSWAGKLVGVASGNGEKSCDAAIITSICSGAKDIAKAGVVGAATTGEPDVSDILKPIPTAFRNSIIGCIKAAASASIKNVASEATAAAAKSAAAKAAAGGMPKFDRAKFLQGLALQACVSGSKIIGDQIDAVPSNDLKTSCNFADPQRLKYRAKACMATAGSLCRAAGGSVKLEGLIGKTDGELAQIARDLGELGLDTACKAGGPGTSVVCGTISEAAMQIRKAIMTGDNDWAQCYGTSQWGECGGKLFGEWITGRTVESMQAPIATVKQSNEGEYRLCCHCEKKFYQNDSWVKDTHFRTDNWMSVTSNDGGVDCRARQSGTHTGVIHDKRKGFDVYYQFANCTARNVKGTTCSYPGNNYPQRTPRQTMQYYTKDGWQSLQMGTVWCLNNDC